MASRNKSVPDTKVVPTAPRPTKLTPPDASGLVARQRLHDLADSRRAGVLWVSSPAGGGKSSFVATWCRSMRDTRVVWFHVDADDADPASLFAWLARSVGDSAAASALPRWSVEQALDPVRFGQRFFRAYADALCADDRDGGAGAAVLVFDNVHDAAGSPLFCALLHELVKAKPPSMTVVLTSRYVPADALLLVTAQPRFAAIGWAELRCTDDEAQAMALAWGLAAPTSQVLALAGGWVSALVTGELRHGMLGVMRVLARYQRCLEGATRADTVTRADPARTAPWPRPTPHMQAAASRAAGCPIVMSNGC